MRGVPKHRIFVTLLRSCYLIPHFVVDDYLGGMMVLHQCSEKTMGQTCQSKNTFYWNQGRGVRVTCRELMNDIQ